MLEFASPAKSRVNDVVGRSPTNRRPARAKPDRLDKLARRPRPYRPTPHLQDRHPRLELGKGRFRHIDQTEVETNHGFAETKNKRNRVFGDGPPNTA